MRPPRLRFTVRFLMALVLLAAIWLFIFVQGDAYRRRFPGGSSYYVPSRTSP